MYNNLDVYIPRHAKINADNVAIFNLLANVTFFCRLCVANVLVVYPCEYHHVASLCRHQDNSSIHKNVHIGLFAMECGIVSEHNDRTSSSYNLLISVAAFTIYLYICSFSFHDTNITFCQVNVQNQESLQAVNFSSLRRSLVYIH